MQQSSFNPHAKILHDGQYKIKQMQPIPVPIKTFELNSNQEQLVKDRIENMQLEIQYLEDQIAEKRRLSESNADMILAQVKDDARKMIEEAEQHAFDRVQKSLQDKEEIFQKTTEEINKMKESAHNEAKLIKEEAEKEAIDIRAKAKDQGFVEGKEQGLQDGHDDIKFAVDRLHSIIGETARERERILVHSESQVINLVLSMVNKVVKKLASEHKDVVIENTKAALELLRSAMTIFIRVSPHDFNYVSSFKQDLVKMIESRADLKFIEDPTIDPGGVYIETDTGDVDATIRSQLEEIEHQMRFYMPVKIKTPETKKREQKENEINQEKDEKKSPSEDIDIPITKFATRTAHQEKLYEPSSEESSGIISEISAEEPKKDEFVEINKAVNTYKENTEAKPDDSSHDDFIV